jgi:hypothetical protein
MASVRITTNRNHPASMEWLVALPVGATGRIERSKDVPEDVCAAIERGIAAGNIEGDCFVNQEERYHWFFDR